MEFHRQIKKNARISLRGSWGKAVAIVFTILGVYLLVSALEQTLYLVLGLTGFQDIAGTPGFYLDDTLTLDLRAVTCTGLSSLLLFLLGVPLSAGSAGWYFSLSAGSPMGFEGLFRPFFSGKSYVRTLSTAFLLGIRSVLWGMLFLIPPACLAALFLSASEAEGLPFAAMLIDLGYAVSQILFAIALIFLFVFLQRYSLVFYLLADRPQTPTTRIIALSVKMMRGHCWEATALKISFLGWQLLSVLVLPMLYVMPYYYASMAIYARYVVERFQRVQMGEAFSQSNYQQQPFAPAQDVSIPMEDSGKTREYTFSELQEQMGQR